MISAVNIILIRLLENLQVITEEELLTITGSGPDDLGDYGDDDDDEGDDDDDDEGDDDDDEGDDDDDEGDDDDDDDDDPCSNSSQQAGEDASDTFNTPSLQGNIGSVDSLNSGATQNEWGFQIRDINGAITPASVEDITTGGGLTTYPDTVADLHTHYDNAPPSAQDLISLAGGAGGNSPNLGTSYVLTVNGTLYGIVITDKDKATAFYNENKNNLVGTNWDPSSDIGVNFTLAHNSFASQTTDGNEQYLRAMTAVMDGSGMKMTVTDLGTNDFKKVGAVPALDSNGNPIMDSQNNPVYKTSDCP